MKATLKNNTVGKAKGNQSGLLYPKNDHAPRTEYAEFSDEVIQAVRDTNNVLKSAEVHPLARGGYANMKDGIFGIESLICSILKKHEAVFPKGAEKTALRNIVIASGMLTEEIESEVRKANGYDKYPHKTLTTYLCNTKDVFGRVQLTGEEDQPRTSSRPRKRWYLIQDSQD